jgi:hypothetical protein
MRTNSEVESFIRQVSYINKHVRSQCNPILGNIEYYLLTNNFTDNDEKFRNVEAILMMIVRGLQANKINKVEFNKIGAKIFSF